jgi:amino acid transporter
MIGDRRPSLGAWRAALCGSRRSEWMAPRGDSGDAGQPVVPDADGQHATNGASGLPTPDNSESIQAAELLADIDGVRRRSGGAGSRRVVVPDIDWREERRGRLPGNGYIRVLRSAERDFEETPAGTLRVGEHVIAPKTPTGRAATRVKRFLIGRPLATEQAVHERLTKIKALAVLSSDALSSVAYATEEALVVLVLAGAVAFNHLLPISVAIVLLLAIVALSYRQTIYAYPNGGGSYIVARENLGTLPGLIAAGSLLIDYVLTVSVSVSAGVLAIVSAFHSLAPWTVPIGLGFIALIMIGNLRGVRESGTIFALPTYLFIVSMLVLVAAGISRIVLGDPAATGVPRDPLQAQESLTLFLILRAFASGCTALTGVEAISNGIPAFKPPESKNAAKTLTAMVVLLGVMFMGTSILAHAYGIVPRDNDSVVSQVAEQVFGGRGLPYLILQIATCLILVLAANTSFADFPRLGSILARDGFLPKQFQFRGDRLAFSTGIIFLSVLSGALYALFGGETDRLIPLYAVGVFVSFTLSQAGMVRHWQREPGNHRRSMIINGVGAVATGIVAVIIGGTKFIYGAWIVILIIPVLVLMFRAINRHYQRVEAELQPAPGETRATYLPAEHVVVVPVSTVNKATLNAIAYAHALSSRIVAVHVTDDAAEAAHLQADWDRYDEDANLVILESPYRSLIAPLLSYIDAVQKKHPQALITVLVPEYVPPHWWEQLLHSQTALRLKASLLFRPNTVVTSVPYHSAR